LPSIIFNVYFPEKMDCKSDSDTPDTSSKFFPCSTGKEGANAEEKIGDKARPGKLIISVEKPVYNQMA